MTTKSKMRKPVISHNGMRPMIQTKLNRTDHREFMQVCEKRGSSRCALLKEAALEIIRTDQSNL
jgi:hypothetical protein